MFYFYFTMVLAKWHGDVSILCVIPGVLRVCSKPLMATTQEGDLLVIDSVMIEDSDKQKQLVKFCPSTNTWSCSKVQLQV
jgi:hypothetical protein